MKKLFKNIVKAFAIVALVANISGDTWFATNNLAAGSHHLFNGPKVVTQISITTTNDTPTIIRLYDGAITNVTAAYTSYTGYSSNVVTSVITSTGTTNTFTNSVYFVAPVSNDAATNNTPVKIAGSVDKYNPLIIIPSNGAQYFLSRMTLSNNATGVSALVGYRSP